MAGILRIIRYTILLLLAFAVGATAVFTLTGQGRENLAGLASRLASTPAQTISISGLDGIWSGPLTLGTVVVGDEDGPWLKASGVEIDLSYLAIMLSNTVKADRLKVARLEVARLPRASEAAQDSGEFALPVDIELGDIDLPDIALGGDLAGEVATLSAKGKLFARSSPLRIETTAAVARTDGKQGNLDLAVLFAPDDNTLDVTVNGSEPQGGVLANFLKFPGAPPVAVSVTGSGPASDWRGEGTFSVDGAVVTRLSGRHQFVAAGSRVEAKGDGDFARFLPAGLRAAAEGRTVIDFAGTLGAGGTVDIEAARLESNTVVATAKGRVDPAGASDFALNAEAKAAPVRLAFGNGDDAVTVDIRSAEASVTGSGATPVVDAALSLAQLITPQVKLTDVGLDVSSTAFDVRTRTGPVDAQLSAATVSSNIAGLAPYLVGQFAAAIKADIGTETIAVTRASIEGEALSATASGTLVRTDGSADIDFTGDVTTAALPGAARGVLGERLAIAGTFLRKADGAVDFSAIDIKSGKLAAAGSAGLAGGVVQADLTGTLADLSGLAAGVSGAATFAVTANGPVVGPMLTLKLNSDRIESGGRAITGLALTAAGSANAAAPAADISLIGMVEGQALKGSAKLATSAGRREVSGIALTLGENRISGDLVLDDAFLPVGSVDFTLPDIAPLAALALQQASGAASGRIVFETAADGPSATIDATVQSFRRGDISGQTIGIEASVANYIAQPAVSGRIRAASVTAGTMAISGIDVRLARDGEWTGFDGGATAAGIPAKARGRAKFENGIATIELDAGSATVRGIAASIAKRSTIVNADGVTRLEQVSLSVGGGSAVVSGTVGETLALDATLSGIPASLADSFAPGLGATGTVAGTVRITGQASAPAVAYDLTLSGAATGQTRSAGFGGLQIASTGTFAGGTLTFDATVGDGSGITMRGGGSVVPGGAINVQFNGKVPFGFLTSRLAAQGLSLSGAADVAITVRGSTSSPDIGGTVRASGARLIDARSGIAIGDINTDIALGGGVATLRAFTGSISTGGTISASGTIGIDGATGFPADLSVKVAEGRYTDGRVVTANFGGDITIKGPLLSTPVLAGRIDLGRTVITLPEKLPGALTKLNVKHKNASGAVDAQAEAMKPAQASGGGGGLTLDLTVDAPSQIFVQGRGLDAELGGTIRLTGSTAAPQATGLFTLRRGRFSILGRRLDFTRGTLGFAGSLVPTIDFEATSSVNSSTVTVTVSGEASDPKFAFSSSPSAPEDEVLAQLVFGRSMSSLSPLQIAQLAEAAAQLAGVGGPTSLLDTLRGKLGVDDLDVKTDEKTGDTSVSVGKYLNDRTYVTIEKGSNPGSGKAAIDLNVGKGVKLRGEAADDGSTKGGIFFEKEY